MILLSSTLFILGIIIMSAQFDALAAQVAVSNATAQSAVDAVNALATRSTEDPVAVQALTDALKTSSDALAAAVDAAATKVGAKRVANASGDGDSIYWGT